MTEAQDDNESFLNAVLYAMHFMASADKVLTTEEIDVIGHVIGEVSGLVVKDEQIIAVSNALDLNAGGDEDGYWEGVFSRYQSLTIGNRQNILKCAIMTAAADGEFQREEQVSLHNLGEWLGLTPDQVRSTLDKIQRDAKG